MSRAMTSVRILLSCLATAASFTAPGSPWVQAAARRASPPQAAAVPADNVTPLFGQILVDLQSKPSTTTAGILLPTCFEDDDEIETFAKPEPRAGTIVAMGPGAITKSGDTAPMPPLSVGQKVVVAPTAGMRIQEEGKLLRDSTLFLFEAQDIWASCEDN